MHGMTVSRALVLSWVWMTVGCNTLPPEEETVARDARVEGLSACEPGYTACDGVCTDVMSDNQNCGGCGNNCYEYGGAHWVCSGGYCTYSD